MITRNPSSDQAGTSEPSTIYQTLPPTPGDIRSLVENLRTDGISKSLYATVLRATDLLGGNADIGYIVLEFAAVHFGSGERKSTVNWHGPYTTESEARRFVHSLAKQPPIPAGATRLTPKAQPVSTSSP